MASSIHSNNGRDVQVSRYINAGLTRHDFPSDFAWGVSTAAYQVEGAYAEDRKGLANWDVFSMQRPAKIADGSNGCIAIDHYNRFEEDVLLMKRVGINSYRFSMSWSRILPAGRLSGGVNREGIKFYNDLIDKLISQGIEPFVCLFHFDFPQPLQEEYGGFLSHRIVEHFAEYAEICFYEFGDRVKHWITINEPWTFTHNGYISGNYPPGHGSTSAQHRNRHRCHNDVDQTCHVGDAGTEPYIAAHHLLLSHAKAVNIYKKHFQLAQGGIIGMTNMTTWYDPFSLKKEDIDAASRAVDFMWGWFVAPIVTGDYPHVMRQRVGHRLPKFTQDETALLKGSYDFIGMNYYTSNWASYKPTPHGTPPTYYTDQEAEFHTERDGVHIGKPTGSTWLFVVPHGIYDLLLHTKNTYNDPIIYITENGTSEVNDKKLTITEARKDEHRISYHVQHLAYMKLAMEHGVRLRGYFPWSMFDNYEWSEGYTVRFGFYYVDYVHGLNRYPKKSAIWYMGFLSKNRIAAPRRQVEEIEDSPSVKKRRGVV